MTGVQTCALPIYYGAGWFLWIPPQKKVEVKAKEFQWFTYQLKSAKEINALVLSGYADRFETPESIGFLKNIKGIEFV